MGIENLLQQINENAGNLSGSTVKIEGIKTTKDVDQLIELLSTDSLKMGNLNIKIDDGVSDYFISKFINMETKPAITKLTLSDIKLSHESWKNFFVGLKGFKGLKDLHLENSNFDYSNDLKYLGEYIAGNPTLKETNLCSDEKIGDTTFESGSKASELLSYLQTNTNLISIKYGHPFDDILSTNLSNAIKQKLDANALVSLNEKRISESVSLLKNDTYLLKLRGKLEQFVIASIEDSLLKGTENESKIELDVYGLPMSIKNINIELAKLQENFHMAMQDEDFSKGSQIDRIKNLGKYYYSQYCLIGVLNEMYQQELEASSHDKPILHNLREDFLKNWKAAAKIEDINLRNQKINEVVESMLQNCGHAKGEVKDKASGALIKNALLILSAILTFGISLGIYAAVTKQSRAERGSFFFKDTELSGNKIDEVKKKLEDVQTEVKKYQNNQ
ncbi:hypothetical protein TUM19329_07300 [Legionella antarctica]|uniref:Uncharacterized protein n=1 Tax=Legionella antarctica TaxID=2708020 RepID=A0A6F8T1Q8_9GAMM|nr:hypothetical protein [Legionella antarctica]BCA94369.1 hypothetical protein TUM19329_07300 [Legionella antarctica]